ncbi:MAG: hypoxanthine phosphoribosyltransferase [Myxococcota bacterium]|jgi:hypoxanthine phosphoribosyltransferase
MSRTVTPLIDAETIATRTAELGARIRADYAGKPLVCVGVLKGSVVFLADLVRHLDPTTRLEFLAVSSYSGTQSTGTVRITHDLKSDVSDCHVLIVEDIVDTGLTLSYLYKLLETRKPASLRIVTLLDKPSKRKVPVPVDYIGFKIEDRFVVGYGLDLDEEYRTLPFVGEITGD